MPLCSGAVHYWRLDPGSWRPALQQIQNLGLPMVETYIPWGVHEKSAGTFDFGEKNPRLAVGRFLDLAREIGLYAFVRPGPHINAEMTFFGLPERVVYDRACQARSSKQNPVIIPWPPQMFPVPSYASTRFAEETGNWYRAVAAALDGRLYPDGPVVLLQVDNEAAYYFRNGPYDQDYHPDSLALYRRFLEDRYGTIEAARERYRHTAKSWADIDPPEQFDPSDPLVPHLDWALYQEEMIEHALTDLRARMEGAGLRPKSEDPLPTVHNVSLGDGGLPVSIPGLEKTVDVVGMDYYHPAREHDTIKRRTLYLAGTTNIPYSPELGIGAPPWFTPLTHADSFYCAMCACAYGLRGFNLYMAVDRDRWFGAPIDAQGMPRLEAAQWKTLIHRLRETAFHELERKAEVALLIPREYQRLSRATHLFGGVYSPSAVEAMGGSPVDGCRRDNLGFRQPIQTDWWKFLSGVAEVLTELGVPYVYVDSEAAPSRLEPYRLLLTPSFEFAASARWKAIASRSQEGAMVGYGPHMPELDDKLQPHLFEVPKNSRRFSRIDGPALASELRALIDELDLEPSFRVTPSPLEITIHEDQVGPRVAFLLNPGDERRSAQVSLPAASVFTDLFNNERFEGDTDVAIDIGARRCRMFLVEPLKTARGQSRRPPRARRRAS
ncbi:MAG: beta-galactosidase [Myxococcota bacterium]